MDLTQMFFSILAVLFVFMLGVNVYTNAAVFGGYPEKDSALASNINNYTIQMNTSTNALVDSATKIPKNAIADPVNAFQSIVAFSANAANILLQPFGLIVNVVGSVSIDLNPFGIPSTVNVYIIMALAGTIGLGILWFVARWRG